MNWLLNPEVRPVWGASDEPGLLAAYEKVWNRKRILRQLYEGWYHMLYAELGPGSIVEVGAGTGNFKRWLAGQGRRCHTLDILAGTFVDLQADAVRLPFGSATVGNFVLFDTLHHLARPRAFLQQAAECLGPGGRVVMLEPFVSWWGGFVYRHLHHERVDFGFVENSEEKAAWDGNAAIPQLVLAEAGNWELPLRLIHREHLEFLAYPLCGGFSYRSLLPGPFLQAVHHWEQHRLFRNRFVSLRVFAVLEKA